VHSDDDETSTSPEKYAIRAFVDITDHRAWVEIVSESGKIVKNTKLSCFVLRPPELFQYLPDEIARHVTMSRGVQITREQQGFFAIMIEPKIEGFVHDGRVAYAMIRQLTIACEKAGLTWFYLVTREPSLQTLVHKFLQFAYLHKFVGGTAILHKSLPVPAPLE